MVQRKQFIARACFGDVLGMFSVKAFPFVGRGHFNLVDPLDRKGEKGYFGLVTVEWNKKIFLRDCP